jgi:hypothetical protein
MGAGVSPQGVKGAGFSPQRVHGDVTDHRVFTGKGVRRQGHHCYRCLSTEGKRTQVPVHRLFLSTNASPQRVHGYRCHLGLQGNRVRSV